MSNLIYLFFYLKHSDMWKTKDELRFDNVKRKMWIWDDMRSILSVSCSWHIYSIWISVCQLIPTRYEIHEIINWLTANRRIYFFYFFIFLFFSFYLGGTTPSPSNDSPIFNACMQVARGVFRGGGHWAMPPPLGQKIFFWHTKKIWKTWFGPPPPLCEH